jgi:N-acetyl-gamma-glutamyl-phosphate reductase
LKPVVYIDGAAGTTGLEIGQRLEGRADLTVALLPGGERKDVAARRRALNEANVAVLCLPDDAARQAVALIENPRVRVLDAATAHRTAPGWVYGFAELEPDRRAEIANASRVSNPGCYATGFLALVRPLVRAGLVPADFPLTVHGVSGFSGGGKAMIEEFQDSGCRRFTRAVVRTYALTVSHKHVPEMQTHARLAHPPIFAPSVGRFYRGMIVEVPLQLWALPARPEPVRVREVLEQTYSGDGLIDVEKFAKADSNATLDAEMLAGSDRMKLFVFGNEAAKQARLVAVLDNLGKGASGAAVQNLNLMLGIREDTGLR